MSKRIHKDQYRVAACCLAFSLALAPLSVGAHNFSWEATVTGGSTWETFVLDGDTNLKEQRLGVAEQCYRRALKAVEKSKHTTDDLVECLEKLAGVLALEDLTPEAIDVYRRALHILEEKYGKDNRQVVPTLLALGSIYESEGDHSMAMELYQRALAINEKSYGPFSPAVAVSLHRLGRASFNAGHTGQAEQSYKRSLTILMQDPGLTASSELEELLKDYGDLMRKTESSDNQLTSDFQKEFLDTQTGVHGENSNSNVKATPAASAIATPSAMATPNAIPEVSLRPARTTTNPDMSSWQEEMSTLKSRTMDTQTNTSRDVVQRGFGEPFNRSTLTPAYGVIADALGKQTAYKEEVERYERMVAIDSKSLGPNHPSVADDLYGLSLLYISQRRYADAQPLLQRVLSIYESAYGKDSLLVSTVRGALATVATELNKPTLGAHIYSTTLFGGVLDAGQIALEPTSLETARFLNDLGFTYLREGKLEDACTIYQWALASTEAAVGSDNPLLAACLNDYARVLRELGRASEAGRIQLRAAGVLLKARSNR